MSDLTPPEQMPSGPSGPDRRIVWTVAASLLLHAGVLAFLLWPPLRDSAEAAPPEAIAVELVPPPESSSSEPPPSSELPSSLEPPSSEAPDSSEAPSAEPSGENTSSAETASVEPPAAEPAGSDTASAAASADAASEPPQSSEASAEPPPTPMSRPLVIPVAPSEDASAAASSAVEDGVSALATSTGDLADGTAPPTAAEAPDVATLELGGLHTAKRFYLEAMLSSPAMARARDALKQLPRDKRLSQTCNIEAIAQVGSADRGFTPDVIMADAYAKSVAAGARYTASGAIFRSDKKWYGLAYDCTLSTDLTSVTAFSYRIGADVTAAVVARLDQAR